MPTRQEVIAALTYLVTWYLFMTEKTLNFDQYVEQTAQLLNLPVVPEYRDTVVENFARIAAIANLVIDFPLSEDIEPAPVFEP